MVPGFSGASTHSVRNPRPTRLPPSAARRCWPIPLLDFDKLLMIRRDAKSQNLGLPQNWEGNCSLPRSGYQDSISRARQSPRRRHSDHGFQT